MPRASFEFVFDGPYDETAEAEADAAAEAEFDAGKGILHAEVPKRLESWGEAG